MASLEDWPCDGLWPVARQNTGVSGGLAMWGAVACCQAEYGMNEAMRTVVQQVKTRSHKCLIILPDSTRYWCSGQSLQFAHTKFQGNQSSWSRAVNRRLTRQPEGQATFRGQLQRKLTDILNSAVYLRSTNRFRSYRPEKNRSRCLYCRSHRTHKYHVVLQCHC